jgi:hypothetical protein
VRLVEVDVVGLQPLRDALQLSTMCLRDRPRSFGPSPVGQYTFVNSSIDSRRTPLRASPRTVSARVPA